MWYHRVIGGERCPIVDTWWQTETGAIMITPLPGVTATKPGSATRPLPGISADVVDEDGNSVPFGGGGFLVLDRPWPAMARTIYGDPDRYVATYWSRFPGKYFPGRRGQARRGGLLLAAGSGRRHHAGVGAQHLHHRSRIRPGVAPGGGRGGRRGAEGRLTGQAIAAFVTLRGGAIGDEALLRSCGSTSAKTIGPIAKPKSIVFTNDLPKTRSGKIMRRLLKDISEHRQLGDVTTLANEAIVEEITAMATRACHRGVSRTARRLTYGLDSVKAQRPPADDSRSFVNQGGWRVIH